LPLRYALFGGSFDPVHRGHLALATAAAVELRLDRVFFVPAYSPPHKAKGALSVPKHRVAMLRRAIRSNPRFRVSDWEIRRRGTSYTYRTLQAFRRRFPRAEWWLLVGGDSLRNWTTWRRWQWILANSCVAVARRSGVPLTTLSALVHKRVVFLRVRLPAVSSSEVRRRARAGRPIASLVPPGVASYIRRQGLYRS
jgi:nicotinate-nucleotide adenylyltransferase